MKHIDSLRRLQDFPICPCTEPAQSSPRAPSYFLNPLFNIVLPSTPRSSKWLLSLSFSQQINDLTLDIM